MSARLPLLPTLLVAAAVAMMIALGVWQLGRSEEKAALLARYGAAEASPGIVPYPATPAQGEQVLYRRSALDCTEALSVRETAGRSARGEPGWAVIARCRLPGGETTEVALGWSRAPGGPVWSGGRVNGIIAPAGEGTRLVASPPQAGLAELARPDPGNLPNNHLSYAVQWFFFAGTAIVIYLLALRRRRQG